MGLRHVAPRSEAGLGSMRAGVRATKPCSQGFACFWASRLRLVRGAAFTVSPFQTGFRKAGAAFLCASPFENGLGRITALATRRKNAWPNRNRSPLQAGFFTGTQTPTSGLRRRPGTGDILASSHELLAALTGGCTTLAPTACTLSTWFVDRSFRSRLGGPVVGCDAPGGHELLRPLSQSRSLRGAQVIARATRNVGELWIAARVAAKRRSRS